MFELLLVILADQLATRIDERRRVVALFAVSLQHPGDKEDLQFLGQAGQPAKVDALRDRFAQCPVLLERDRLVGDGIAVQKTLRRANDLPSVRRRLADQGFDPAVIGLLVPTHPFEHDSRYSDRVCA